LVERAFDLVQPAILAAMETGLFKRKHLHIVVFDPVVTQAAIGDLWPVNEDRLRQAIAGKRDFRDETPWNLPYDEFARAKALLSWRTRRPSREVVGQSPYLMHEGSIIYGGSVIRDDLIVAASGVQPEFDELAAGWMADAVIALTRQRVQVIQSAGGGHYLQGDKLVPRLV
jgi:hypothetical protein